MTMLKKIYTILFALVVLFCSCGTEENTPELPGTDGNGSGGDTEITLKVMTYRYSGNSECYKIQRARYCFRPRDRPEYKTK